MEYFIEKCRELSLTSRLSIALLIFERFCSENKINHNEISVFVDYLWEWPIIKDSSDFIPWESSKPELIHFGLGEAISKELKQALDQSKIQEKKFRELVSGVVEILWSSFWGASEQELSLKSLRTVLLETGFDNFPPIEPFSISKFNQNSGWGMNLSKKDYSIWRNIKPIDWTN